MADQRELQRHDCVTTRDVMVKVLHQHAELPISAIPSRESTTAVAGLLCS